MQSPGSSTSGAIPLLKLFGAVRVRCQRRSGRARRAIGAAESDPGCVKTKSDLVVMPSRYARIG